MSKPLVTAGAHDNVPARVDGYLPLRGYAALGDGRTVALTGADGSIDWWCLPDTDAMPLFDRLWDAERGGCFVVAPDSAYKVERRYREGSNLCETLFVTKGGSARLIESINSGRAGRLPWCELARRIEGVSGTVGFRVLFKFSAVPGAPVPQMDWQGQSAVFHWAEILGSVICSAGVAIRHEGDGRFEAAFGVAAGQRETLAIVAGKNEPLVRPSIEEIDRRIDTTDTEWREWSAQVEYSGEHRELLLRSALALKLLLFSPTGAIAAAPTAALPETFGGERNYDYRYAWIRDSAYIIKAFMSLKQYAEGKAAFTWIVECIAAHGPRVMYTLNGKVAPKAQKFDRDGYRKSRPVQIGNAATTQHQHGMFGDALQVAFDFVQGGNVLDRRTANIMVDLADHAAKRWRDKDSGIWELEQSKHYTMSKISCWQALDRAIALAEQQQIADRSLDAWKKERAAIVDWVDENCWSNAHRSYMAWNGSDELDAALTLGIRFGFPRRERLEATLAAIDRDLGAGAFHYRCSWSPGRENCFLACTLWILLAKLSLGLRTEAEKGFKRFLVGIGDHVGLLPEMIDPDTGDFLGNIPLGLTHLAMVQLILELYGGAKKAD